MAKKVANSDVARLANNAPDYEIEGYGNVSYSPRGYYTGHLPRRIESLFYDTLRRNRYVPTIYSYGTPIAWRDGDVWIVPNVSYSITTAKHQGYLHGLSNRVSVPRDCGADEYVRYRDGFSVYRPHLKPHVIAA